MYDKIVRGLPWILIVYVTYVTSCCRFILLPHWCHRTAVSMAHTCSHPQRVRDVRRGLSGTLCMISVLVVGFVNVCDTRAFITCQYFGTCEVGSSSCWFMTLPHAYSMINPRCCCMSHFICWATAINPTKKRVKDWDLSLHSVTKLPCHRYTPSFRHNMGTFSG